MWEELEQLWNELAQDLREWAWIELFDLKSLEETKDAVWHFTSGWLKGRPHPEEFTYFSGTACIGFAEELWRRRDELLESEEDGQYFYDVHVNLVPTCIVIP